MPRTSIEWTDYSWPVVNGCRRISPGCECCYAERLAATRLRHTARYRGLAVMKNQGPQWTGKTRLVEDELLMPLRLRKPSRIFCADMGDLFFDGVDVDDIVRVFAVMAVAKRHTFQVLTKRASRMRLLLSDDGFWADVGFVTYQQAILGRSWSGTDAFDAWWDSIAMRKCLPNVHVGVSVETQATADQRIPELQRTPAALRWISLEPQLESVDLDDERDYLNPRTIAPIKRVGSSLEIAFDQETRLPRIDWVVVGGESGPRARPFDLSWARTVLEQCRSAGVACFIKQLGARPLAIEFDDYVRPRHRKGADPSEWPADLRVREMPEAINV